MLGVWVFIAFPSKELISSKLGFHQQSMELHLEPAESLLAQCGCTL